MKTLLWLPLLLLAATANADVKFPVNCTSTYLFRASGDSVTQPTKIRLADYGLAPGDRLLLTETGLYKQRNPPYNTDKVSGIFSRDGVYAPGPYPRSVPNAIKAGPAVITQNSWWKNVKTDLPEDFSIQPTGTHVVVPSGATYLFLGVDDNLFYDNGTLTGVSVTISRLGRASTAGRNKLTPILPKRLGLRSGATSISKDGVVGGWVGPLNTAARNAATFTGAMYQSTDVYQSGNSLLTCLATGRYGGTYAFATSTNAHWDRPFKMTGTTTSVLFNGYGVPVAMNTTGDIAGYNIKNYIIYPVKVVNGIGTQIDTASRTGEATGINSRGDVVGFFPNVPGPWIASSGTNTATTIPISATMTAYPVAINDQGVIAGNYVQTAGTGIHNRLVRGFIYDSTHGFRDIGTLSGGVSVEVAGMNNLGQIVGSAVTAQGATHAFVWNGTTMTDLGTLDGDASYATAINDAGDIVGTGLDISGHEMAFRTKL